MLIIIICVISEKTTAMN